MSVNYFVYAEAKLKDEWVNISPIIEHEKGEYRAFPLIAARSDFRDAADRLADLSSYAGMPKDPSEQFRANHMCFYRTDNPSRYLDASTFIVNYQKGIKDVLKNHPCHKYHGYVYRHLIAEYEVDNYAEITYWLTKEEYNLLDEEEKLLYQYYEWDYMDDWYYWFRKIETYVDALIDWHQEWCKINLTNGYQSETDYMASNVRLIVIRE